MSYSRTTAPEKLTVLAPMLGVARRWDREVVEAAVRQSGAAIRHACPVLRADRALVLLAVSQSGGQH